MMKRAIYIILIFVFAILTFSCEKRAVLRKMEQPHFYEKSWAVVRESKTHLYREARLDSVVIGTLDEGEQVQILSRSKKQVRVEAISDYWYQVSTEGGFSGWVFGHYLEFDPNIEGFDPYMQRIKEIVFDGLTSPPGDNPDQVIENLGQPVQLKTREVKNQYYPNSTDFIYELSYDGYSIQIYHASAIDRDVVISYRLTNPTYDVKWNLNVGTSRESLLKKLGSPHLKEGIDYLYFYPELGYSSVRFTIENDMITRIVWLFYYE